MPGNVVATVSVTVRIASGASGLGSKVSNWLGPPCWKRKMTDLPVVSADFWLGAARAAQKEDKVRPPRPRVPMVRKERREMVSGRSKMLSIPVVLFGQAAGREGRKYYGLERGYVQT